MALPQGVSAGSLKGVYDKLEEIEALLGGVGATNANKAEDAAHTTADVGTGALFVRTPAAPATQTSADGDYGFPALDSFGDVKTLGVDITGTALTYLAAGRADAAASIPVVLANGDRAGDYETVAASQTAQVLGGAGATGDFIKRLIIIPASVTPGLVTLLDNAISIPVYVGGTVSAELKPFIIDVGAVSVSGAWKLTTGANLSVIAVGKFT